MTRDFRHSSPVARDPLIRVFGVRSVWFMTTRSVLTFVQANRRDDRVDDRDLAQLNEKYRAPLMRYVRRLTFGDQYLAEDIVQETLLRLWQRPRTLATHHASVLPWLFTVARNLVLDHRRARSARPAEVSDAAVQDAPAAADEIEAALTAHAMKQALFQLSADHRAVLVAVYYRGLSLAEASVELGIPVGTVKSRIYYALRTLRLMVDKYGVTTEMNRTASTAKPTGKRHSDLSLPPSVA